MSEPQPPSPLLLFETINAYQRSAAIKAAIELDLFSALAAGHATAPTLAGACQASERGIRILADYLVVCGFLRKQEDRYSLGPDAAVFLDRRSPAYMGGVVEFLLSPMLLENFQDLTDVVRRGTTASHGTVAPEHPVWVQFARAMMPMMGGPAGAIAELVQPNRAGSLKVLDIAAGHGLFGIAFARRYPEAQIYALDWPQVLDVAQQNAAAAGVGDRYHRLPGSAFDVDLGGGYDLVLLTNFLHHFDEPTCVELLRKVRASLAEGGRVATLEFVPNEDRVTPPAAAAFSLTMLATTPSGDAYTFAELERMFRSAGFGRSEAHELPHTIEQLIVSYRDA